MPVRFLDKRLTHLKGLIASMGGCVEQMIKEVGTLSFEEIRDKEQLFDLIQIRERKIDEFQIRLDKYCFRALARQAPVARDLRMVLSILSINTSLERMGDLALSIAKRAKGIEQDPLLDLSLEKLGKMFNYIASMVRNCLDAFINEDEELAKKVILQDDQADKLKYEIGQELKKCILANVELVDTAIQLVSISEKLERIGDQATNIAEEVIFLETGMDIKHSNIEE